MSRGKQHAVLSMDRSLGSVSGVMRLTGLAPLNFLYLLALDFPFGLSQYYYVFEQDIK